MPASRLLASADLLVPFRYLGAVAQLAECLHGMQEAGGSNPPSSTNRILRLSRDFGVLVDRKGERIFIDGISMKILGLT